MQRQRRTRVLIGLAIALVAIKLIVIWLEPRMELFPPSGVSRTPRELGIPFADLRSPADGGATLQAWWMPHPDARAEIVYFHGNGGNLSLWLDALAAVHAQGWSVLGFDYRGYGASTGTASEQGLY